MLAIRKYGMLQEVKTENYPSMEVTTYIYTKCTKTVTRRWDRINNCYKTKTKIKFF